MWREAVKTLVVPIRFILQESLCIDFSPSDKELSFPHLLFPREIHIFKNFLKNFISTNKFFLQKSLLVNVNPFPRAL